MHDDLMIKITRIIDDPELLPTGGVSRRIRIEFIVGVHGPFGIVLSADEFTEARTREEMEKIAAPIRALAR